MGQPGLVNVYDPLAGLQQGQHLLGVEHPGDETPLGVALVGGPLEEPVAHFEVPAEDFSHLFVLDVGTVFVCQGLTDLLCPPDVPVSPDVRRDAVLDLFPAGHFDSPLLFQLGDGVLQALFVPDQVCDESRFDLEDLSGLPLGETLLAQAS